MPGIIGKAIQVIGGEALKNIRGIIDDVTTNKTELAEAQAKITEIVNGHVERIATLAVESERQLLEDIDSARRMNTEAIKSDDKFVRRFTYYLAAFIVLAGFILFGLLLTGEIPTEQKDIAYVILGSLGGAITTVLAFFFGSTRGSDHKNETIKNLTRTNGNANG